jgi:hypothetical protein
MTATETEEKQPQGPTEEQRAEMDKRVEKIFRARVTVDGDDEPVLAIALDMAGLFLMAGTLNRGMALSTQIMQQLANADPVKRDQARATMSLASAQVKAFGAALNDFVEKNPKLIEGIPGAEELFPKAEEEKVDEG